MNGILTNKHKKEDSKQQKKHKKVTFQEPQKTTAEAQNEHTNKAKVFCQLKALICELEKPQKNLPIVMQKFRENVVALEKALTTQPKHYDFGMSFGALSYGTYNGSQRLSPFEVDAVADMPITTNKLYQKRKAIYARSSPLSPSEAEEFARMEYEEQKEHQKLVDFKLNTLEQRLLDKINASLVAFEEKQKARLDQAMEALKNMEVDGGEMELSLAKPQGDQNQKKKLALETRFSPRQYDSGGGGRRAEITHGTGPRGHKGFEYMGGFRGGRGAGPSTPMGYQSYLGYPPAGYGPPPYDPYYSGYGVYDGGYDIYGGYYPADPIGGYYPPHPAHASASFGAGPSGPTGGLAAMRGGAASYGAFGGTVQHGCGGKSASVGQGRGGGSMGGKRGGGGSRGG